MSGPPGLNWRVKSEAGLVYPPAPFSSSEQLQYPILAEPAGPDRFLIVDELAVDRGVPVRIECRTLLVERSHHISFDHLRPGRLGAYGRVVNESTLAMLLRAEWQLLLTGHDGAVQRSLSLSSLSKRFPRIFSPTPAGTFLILFLDSSAKFDLVEMDHEGRMLWCLESPGWLGVPASLQLLANDNILLADEVRHIAVEIDRVGAAVWQFGRSGDPSDGMDRLSSPKSAHAEPDGTRIVADTRNHRVLEIRPNSLARVALGGAMLIGPGSARRLSSGNYLIADIGNRRVIEAKPNGEIVWQFGNPVSLRRDFSYPRSVEPTADGSLLVADTANNRVVRVHGSRISTLPLVADVSLFWPRAATQEPDGTLVVADGRNSRVVRIGNDGRIQNEIHTILLPQATALRDPHDVRTLPDGNVLVVDPSLDLVFEADWRGRVVRSVGGRASQENGIRLKDPHSAQAIDGGSRWLIADTGNDRLIIIDPRTFALREITTISDGRFLHRLNRPRFAHRHESGITAIADTGNNRLLAIDEDGTLSWELSSIAHPHLTLIDQPRWLYLLGPAEILVCDHYHHRILWLEGSREQPA